MSQTVVSVWCPRYIHNFYQKLWNSEFFHSSFCCIELTTEPILPYFGKRKQVTKVKFLVKEQNVSVIYTDVNGISWCLT